MAQMSVSFKTSSKMTSIKHNNRNLTEEEFLEPAHRHINRELSDQNIYLKQMNLKNVYDGLFGRAVKEYNAGQKRPDRMIDDYYQHVKKSKTLDLQREFVVAIGSKEDWDAHSFQEKKLVAQYILKNYMADFEARNKNLIVYNAAIHLDEAGAPHLHFNVVPVATGYKRGVSKQPSFRKALENLGYTQKGKAQLKAFRDVEVGRIEKYMNQLDIERKTVGTNGIKDMREYKEYVAEVEKVKLEQQEEYQEHVEAMRDVAQEYFGYRRKRDELKNEVGELQEELKDLSEARKMTVERFKSEVDEIAGEVLKIDSEAKESLKSMNIIKKLTGVSGVRELILKFRYYNAFFDAVMRAYSPRGQLSIYDVTKVLTAQREKTLFRDELASWKQEYAAAQNGSEDEIGAKIGEVREKVEERKEKAVSSLDDVIKQAQEQQRNAPGRDLSRPRSRNTGPEL